MKNSNLCRSLAVWLFLSSLLPVSAVTFTGDAYIGPHDTNYDGADLIITNCTLTVDGAHSFASLQILNGGRLTHTAVNDGVFSGFSSITNEAHVLVGTNAATLVYPNVVLDSLRVLDAASSVTFTNELDYILTLSTNGLVRIQRTDTSAIADGATVRVAYQASFSIPSGLNLAVTGDVMVEAGGTINADGRGYDFNLGPGAGGSLASIYSGGGGGGHGGYGGLSASNSPGGIAYGSILQPADKGSGGGNGYQGSGGAGGGAVKLVVGGALRVDGAISANGANGWNERSGGGAGGSLWLTARTLSGSGAITAQGGSGEPSLGGGGGGGRIALYFESNTFAGPLQARGGQGAGYGGAGTIYFRSLRQPVGSVLVDNLGHSGTNTLLVTPEPFNLTVQGNAILWANSPATLGNLLVNSNGWISLSNLPLTVDGDATVVFGGGIISDGAGHPAGSGPGFGRSTSTNGILTGGGGGYGGPGMASALGAGGGGSYGILLQPNERGSGGASVSYAFTPNGGAGGGALRLIVSGTLRVDGRLSANGLAGLAPGSGGGAGGSLWLTVSNLSGTGTLSACGGAGNGLGGGGGGGRIALYFYTNTFNGSLQAWGAGSGSNGAGAGTIYLQDRFDTSATLLVDNGGCPGMVTPLAATQPHYSLVVQGGASVSPSSAQTLRRLFIATNSWLWLTNYSLTVLTDAIIQRGGGVSASGMGYPGSQGQGAGRSLTYYPVAGGSSYLVGGGAGHGGLGGASIAGGGGNSVFGPPTAPTSMGSGGGNGSYSPNNYGLGGAGGGVIRLGVSNTLVLDGLLSANGAAAPGRNAGGGAGGSIWLVVGSLTGAGAISANGGPGNDLGGGGAGGRVAITYQTNSFAGAITAFGALGFNAGGAGTIYLQKAPGQPRLQYIIDNGGQLGALTDLGSIGLSSVDLTIRGRAQATMLYPSSAKLASLLIASNSWLLLSNQSSSLFVASNVIIQAGGGISGNGCGYPAGGGQGAGRSYSYSPAAGGGGGYGGYGGIGGNPMAYGGNCYGPSLMPTQPGSGGATVGTNVGGAGGAGFRLSVDGALVLDGSISVDGNPGRGQSSGGGAGGSLWLTVGSLFGSGSLSANGGAGALPFGGGGGGGRINLSVLSRTNSFTGAVSAFGGSGYSRGGAGTVFTSNGSQNVGLVVIDNNGIRGTNTVLTDGYSFDLTIRGGGALSWSSSSSLSCRNLLLGSNGWLTVATQPLNISGDISIQAGGGILAEGTGYGPGQGPGAGYSTYSGPKGGGGYGGYGGFTGSQTYLSGQTYGSPMYPNQGGSGGANGSGSSYSPLGGAGGGLIAISTPRGHVRVDGSISANGTPGDADSGGGAGGSISLSVGTLSGSGTISANGGAGKGVGGGGGGGRIALNYLTNLFGGTLTASGGAGAPPGGAGTLYSRAYNQNYGQLVLDNNGLLGMGTGLGSGLSSATDLTLQNGAILNPRVSFALRNLLIRSNSWLLFSNSPALTLNGNVTIEPGCGIIADAAGYAPGQGPGAGGSITLSQAGTSGGGGGHGGYGAASFFGARGGNAYDPILTPNLAGSGGGNGLGGSPNNRGGTGGGLINLHVIGDLQNDGRISANGAAGLAPSSGGGAGGSLLLWARTLRGSGMISADGGDGNGWGGGGGGGRIAINCTSNLFSGPIRAFGGGGNAWGGAGTVFVASGKGWNQGWVVADNGGHLGTNTAIPATSSIDLVVQGGANASPVDGYLLLNSLSLRTDGTLTSSSSHTNLDVAVLGDALIESGGVISVEGLGFAQASGPGAGVSSNAIGSGAGYGGAGGASPFLPGGTTYGSAEHPVDRGSGGGSGWGPVSGGSQGGGALRLSVRGALTLNGLISANGNPAFQDDAGGGSGGSIWLSAGSLAGNGSLLAEGGAGDLYQGGGGGGGRIALCTPTNAFTGLLSTAGGPGWFDGSTGSVFFATNFDRPVLVAQSPIGLVSNAVSYIDLVFNNPVNPDAVWYPGFALETPVGTVPGSLVEAASRGASTLRLYLPLQTAVGHYTLRLSRSFASDLFGQPLAADYTNSFTIVLPLIEGRILDSNGVPVPGVLVQSTPGSSVVTDANGYYALGAPLGLSCAVTPSKSDLMFVPGTRYYTNVTGGSFSQDYLAVTSIAPVVHTDCGTTNLVMSWLGIPGVSYQPFASTNLLDWYPYGGLLPGANGSMRLELPIGSEPQLFYRLGASN